MAEGFSDYAIPKMLDHMLGTTAFTKPTAVYAALFVGDPTGAGVEVTGTGYARKAVTFAAATGAGDIGSAASNANADFGTAGAAWGTVDYCAIYDAITGGNMIAYGPLEVSRAVVSGDPVKFPSGSLIVRYTRST
jgi:hypothetical protein